MSYDIRDKNGFKVGSIHERSDDDGCLGGLLGLILIPIALVIGVIYAIVYVFFQGVLGLSIVYNNMTAWLSNVVDALGSKVPLDHGLFLILLVFGPICLILLIASIRTAKKGKK